jgi:SAM-dependent methyltransferase
MDLTYNPGIFEVSSIPEAMQIILTPDGASSADRWAKETPYFAELIGQSLAITAGSVLLDYGCGLGRLAKALIARHGCRVIGVDISPSMRALAVSYVASDRFFTCPPGMLDVLSERGMTVDAAISVWVLQHCLRPAEDIARIRRALKPGGRCLVINNVDRWVPTVEQGWVNDGADIRTLLERHFTLEEEGQLAPEPANPVIADIAFWAKLARDC